MQISRAFMLPLLAASQVMLFITAAMGAPLFSGTWNTVTSLNGHFIINMTKATADGSKINGVFINDGNAKYNGTLAGSVEGDGRGLFFTWEQPRMHDSGFGGFRMSADSRAISGFFYITDPPGLAATKYDWSGTRQCGELLCGFQH